MQDAWLEEYTLYKHASPCNEIVWEFYAHIQLAMDDQTAYLIVKGSEIPFTRAKILRVIPIPDVPEIEPSFTIESIKYQAVLKYSKSFAPISAIMASIKTF